MICPSKGIAVSNLSLEEYSEYVKLSRRLSMLQEDFEWASQHFPTLSHQQFIPSNSSIVYVDPKDIPSQKTWEKFISANSGRLPEGVATWEKWKDHPDRAGYHRFFGTGAPGEMESAFRELMQLSEKGRKILDGYCGLPITGDLAWGLPIRAEGFLQFEFPDLCYWLEYVCWGEPIANPPSVFGLEEAGLKVMQQDDLLDHVARTLALWLPSDEVLEIVSGEPVCQESSSEEKTVPLIESIVVRKGHESFQLTNSSCRPFVVPDRFAPLFGAFVHKLFYGGVGEPVAWHVLHDALLEDKAPSHRASNALRKAKCSLNESMKQWGRPPDGGDWLLLQPGVGYSLNATCNWEIDEAYQQELSRQSQSGWSHWQDTRKMAEDAVDKDHKLPARPWRPNARREEDEESDE